MLLLNRHWQTEILLESFWWSFKEWTHEPGLTKKMHIFGTPIFLGMALVKYGTYGRYEIKIESLLDTLQLEWSPYLSEYILLTIKYVWNQNT